jgi:hypothetical protein
VIRRKSPSGDLGARNLGLRDNLKFRSRCLGKNNWKCPNDSDVDDVMSSEVETSAWA